MKKKEFDITNLFHVFLFAILFLLGFSYITTSNPDSDMWWMMTTGKWIVEHKALPTENVFVIHDGYHMIVQQWIPAILNYTLYHHFGVWGLIALATVLFGVIFFLLWKYIGLFSKSLPCKEITFAISILFLLQLLTTRPTIFTISILLIEMIQLEKWHRDNNWKHLIALPFLSVLEVNIHSSIWPMMFVFALPYLVPEILDGFSSFFESCKRNIGLFLVLLICVAVGGINPNGYEGAFYLFKSYGNGKVISTIQELQSPSFSSFWGFLLVVTVAVFAIYLYRYKKAIDCKNIYLLGGTLVLAFLHIRNFWTVTYGIVPVLCAVLPQTKWDKHIISIKKGIAYIIGGVILLVVIVIKSVGSAEETLIKMPVQEAEYLQKTVAADDIILYTPFSYGGYMEWSGFKVYVDARPELFQKSINDIEDLDEEIYNVQYGIADYDAFVEKYHFTHFLVENNTSMELYLKYSGKYIMLGKSEDFAIYAVK